MLCKYVFLSILEAVIILTRALVRLETRSFRKQSTLFLIKIIKHRSTISRQFLFFLALLRRGVTTIILDDTELKREQRGKRYILFIYKREKQATVWKVLYTIAIV